MELQVDGLSKRFARQWVFRDLTLHIPSGTRVGVTGPNGAGKSTLLKIISGALPQSLGRITYRSGNTEITRDTLYKYLTFAAPYADLIEELTLAEAWQFHRRFKAWLPGVAKWDGFLEAMAYPFDPAIQIVAMSSGMKQRLRLAFAVFTRSELLILDEPTSNLDEPGVTWFHSILDAYGGGRTVIIASNVRGDLRTCGQYVELGSP